MVFTVFDVIMAPSLRSVAGVLYGGVWKFCLGECYRRIMIAIQSAGSSNIVQHLFSAYNYEFD